jgi:hypothetical protein
MKISILGVMVGVAALAYARAAYLDAQAPSPQELGNAACLRAENPAPEARASQTTGDALNGLSLTLDVAGDRIEVSTLQRHLDEATLAGSPTEGLREELARAKQKLAVDAAESDRVHAISAAHDQALKDLADCRAFRNENR